MKFVVYQRHTSPTVSFHTYADVGAYDEEDGVTGVAHLLEHLAFKGTPRIGTNDFRKEAPILDAMDEVFYSMLELNANKSTDGSSSSTKKKALYERQLDQLQQQASRYQIPNAYGALLSRQGAVGLNAATSHDSTVYYCSLPSNKLELWFSLESERFQAPVFRELYSEKKVVFEERRMRVENSPLGPFQEEFSQRSLPTSKYRRPVIGYERDLYRLGRREVAQFFADHYGPASLTVAVVGDVTPSQVAALAEKYFGKWKSTGTPGTPCSDLQSTNMPASTATANNDRTLVAKSIAGPAVLRAYYRPCIRNVQASTSFDVINDVLTGSRSSRLYKNLVLTNKALTVTSYASFPAEKHPNQMAIYAIPNTGTTTLQELDSRIQQEVDDLADAGPSAQELQRYVKAARVGVLEVLQSNSALASSLASYQGLMGDWREIIRDLERVDGVRREDVARVAATYLTPQNCFTGYIVD